MWFTVLLMMFTVMAGSGEGECYLSNADIDVTIAITIETYNNIIVLIVQRETLTLQST